MNRIGDTGPRSAFSPSEGSLSFAFKQDAVSSIACLGEEANRMVPTGSLMHFANWVGWPEWLRSGTSQKGSGPLPTHLTVADDLLIFANILDHGKLDLLIDRIARNVNWPIGPLASLAFANAPKLDEALSAFVRLNNLHRFYFGASVEYGGDRATLLLDRKVPKCPLTDVIALLILLVAERLISTYSHENEQEIIVTCSYAAMSPVSAGTTYDFSAESNRISFPFAWTKRPTQLSEKRLWKVAQHYLSVAEAQGTDHPVVLEIRRRIAEILKGQCRVPRFKEILSDGTSARTTARILAAQGTSFYSLVEAERRTLAINLVNDPSKSLVQTAAALGFPDQSSFGRSFRRWFDETPGRFRGGLPG